MSKRLTIAFPASVAFTLLAHFSCVRASHVCSSTLAGRLLEVPADYKTFDIKETVSVTCGTTGSNESNSKACNTTEIEPVTNGPGWSASNKLKVFVLPHSHNDAGWGWTFEGYYELRTRHILDYMAKYMPQDPDLKLIWAEICFFDRWWRLQNEDTKKIVRRLIENKQLEFVGGGWVMPDEASVHYSSYVTQLLEGHLWLKQRFNYTSINGWTIDPFGLSPTFSLLSKRSGIKSLTYLRIHYAIKTFLAEQRSLEFNWRQFWDSNGETEVFSHVMPYDSYDTASTCGPKSSICEDLRSEILGEKLFNDSNTGYLRARSIALLEQLRKKASLFPTNNVLFPLGGDFRYRTETEWTDGLPHMKNIMKYINSQPDFFAEMKIVTLEEYMSAVQEEMDRKNYTAKTLTGDFFTYDDHNNDYWSGYFTSRIFHKATERKLMALTRYTRIFRKQLTNSSTAQLTFTLMTAEVYKHFGTLSFPFIDALLEKVIETRRALSLFQHHDGITGTSADHVVVDFAKKLDQAMLKANFIIQQCIFVLTNPRYFDKTKPLLLENIQRGELFLRPLLFRKKYNDLWSRKILNVNETNPVETITVVNSLPSRRVQLVRLIVSHTAVKVTDNEGNEIPSEVYPTYFKSANRQSKLMRILNLAQKPSLERSIDYYELVFRAEFQPLAVQNFRIVYSAKFEANVVKPKEYDGKSDEESGNDSNADSLSNQFTIGNKHLALTFGTNGLLKSVSVNGEEIPLTCSFWAYSTNSSGLYLFLPSGEAKPVELKAPKIIVVEGSLQSYVQVVYENIIQRFTLSHETGIESNSIEIENMIDIRDKSNYELIMRLSTTIENGGIFYTDSNGFQMMKRKTLPTNPIQGNYYPVATSAFIEDSNLRMTMLTAQPGGGSSLKPGQFEIMLDRIVNQDDDRGIGQGGTDNLVVLSKVRILFEKPGCSEENNEEKVPALSLEANHGLQQMLNPVQVYIQNFKKASKIRDYKVSDSKLIPCDISIVGTFPLPDYDPTFDNDNSSIAQSYMPRSDFGLVANRISFDERFSNSQLQETCNSRETSLGNLLVTDLFSGLVEGSMEQMSLTFSKQEAILNVDDVVKLKPMEIYSFRIPYCDPVMIS